MGIHKGEQLSDTGVFANQASGNHVINNLCNRYLCAWCQPSLRPLQAQTSRLSSLSQKRRIPTLSDEGSQERQCAARFPRVPPDF
jgi:hypothetical protein